MRLNGNIKSDTDRGGPFRRFASGSALAVTLLGAVAFAPTSAQAVATFDVQTDLSVTTSLLAGDANNVFVDVDTFLDNAVFVTGGASGTATGTATVNGGIIATATSGDINDGLNSGFAAVNFGDNVGLMASANGLAGDSLPGLDSVIADSLNDITFTVTNESFTDAATVRFDWTLSQQIAVNTSIFGEVSDGFSLFDAVGETFELGVPGSTPILNTFTTLDAFAFDGSSDNTGLVVTADFVEVVIPARFGFTFITALVDSQGAADGIVPEPGILPLVGLGLLAVGLGRRRQRS